MLGTILLLVLILLFIAMIPTWPYSRAWGYYPSGFVGFLLLLLFLAILVDLVPLSITPVVVEPATTSTTPNTNTGTSTTTGTSSTTGSKY